MNLIESVSKYLSFSTSEVIAFSQKAPLTYRTYLIPKKDGKFRTIHHPAKETKTLQYALMNLILDKYKIHPSALAYRKGVRSPLKTNAEKHSKYSFSIKMDFKDFFHSIVFEDFKNIVTEKYSGEELEFLKNSLFLKYHGIFCLAIGSPASPILSNIVMYDYDEKTSQLKNSIDPDGVYTRYADDIVFSSNNKSNCLAFAKKMTELVKGISSPSININLRKTILLTKANRKIITGLTITPSGNISIGRSNKKYIKKLLNDLRFKIITPENYKYLRGYLSFVRDVEPRFVNTLTNKYGAELLNQVISH